MCHNGPLIFFFFLILVVNTDNFYKSVDPIYVFLMAQKLAIPLLIK